MGFPAAFDFKLVGKVKPHASGACQPRRAGFRPIVTWAAAMRRASKRRRRLDRCAEDPIEAAPQGLVRLVHRRQNAEIDQAGDAVFLNAARDDAAEMIQIRLNVQADAVEADPFADLHTDGGIVPCGIQEHGVTSLVDLGVLATMDEADGALRRSFVALFGPVTPAEAPL